MVTANELLNSLSATNSETEGHIVIGIDRHVTVPASLKRIAVQYDHDVETVTFDCPRYWDGLDMSEMAIYINYMRSDKYADSYPVNAVTIDETDPDIMHFDWTISRNVTEVDGLLVFLVCIKKTDDYGNETNHWNSELCKDLVVSPGMETQEKVIEPFPDLVTELLLNVNALAKVYVGSGEMPEGYQIQIDPNGDSSENAVEEAVAEALKSKVLVDITLTEEQVASGISGISVAIEDIEAYHNAKQVNIYVEMPFKEKALASSTIAINVSDGEAYADFFGWQHGVTCPQGNTLYWHIFNVRESFHTSNNKKKMCSYYRSPVYYEEPNSLGTCSCLYDGVTHLANLKDHPPKLNLYWSSGGATLEAGTRLFVEVYE